MNKTSCGEFALACIFAVLLPVSAVAQSSIAGVVKDSSGAVMSGATVSISSDVMIEGTKTATTNGDGRYEIIDLRPGTYSVSATSSGFDTVKQSVVVPANVTVPVDATLKPGAVTDTVSVEARVATVDVENAAHPQTLSRQELDDLPTGRYMQSIGSYMPGAHLNLPDIGGSQQIEQNYISIHGNSATQDVYMLDGMLINTNYSDGAIQQYIDNAAIQETTYQSTNVTAEASGGGMLTNLVPRDGSNQYHTSIFLSGNAGSGFWQANNLDANLNARNLAQQDKTVKIEDFDGAFYGPIKKNKLWFTLTGRQQVTFNQAGTSIYPNGAPGIEDGYLYSGTFRLTYQLNDRNKFSAFIERNWKYKGHEILGGTYIPADPSVASTQRNKWPMYYVLQGKWTGTVSNRLVTQAGLSISHLDYNDLYQPGVLQPPGTLANYAGTTQVDNGTLRRYISGTGNNYYQTTRNTFSATATYITGSHQFRAGMNYGFGRNDYALVLNGDGVENFLNGVPTSFTAYNSPYNNRLYLDGDAGLFGMDTWKYKRLAITAGIRWEYLAADINPENSPAGRFSPAKSVPRINCSTIKGLGCWKDWTPRIGAVYDVFGNHKTAVKAGFGKYNSQYSTNFTSPFNPMTLATETTTWNFAGLGAACNPVTFQGVPAPNPLCYATGGFAPQGTATTAIPAGGLGPSSNPLFGTVAGSTGLNLDPNWHRDYSYQYTAGVQQEIYRGTTLNVNWFRRSAYQSNLIVNESAIPLSAWAPYTIDNPINGTPITVYNLSSAIKTLPTQSLYQTNAPQSLVRNTYTGYEFNMVSRLGGGRFVTVGYTLERQLGRNCVDGVTTAKPLQDPNSLRFCDQFGDPNLSFNGINIESLGAVAPPWSNSFVAQGSTPIRWGFVVSTSFQSNLYGTPAAFAGVDTNNGYLPRQLSIASAATSVYPNGCIGCQTLTSGQTCATVSAATVSCPIDPGFNSLQGSETVNLVSPGAVRTPRLTQWNVNIKRTFRIKEKLILEPEFEVFNLLNTNAAISQSTSVTASYSATSPGVAPFLTPQQCGSAPAAVGGNAQCGLGGNVTTITNPRLVKLALVIKW